MDVKAEELFVTRGARGKTRLWNCREERAQGYVRGRNRSFMQGAIVNQSASTADHEVDVGPLDRKRESDPGEKRGRDDDKYPFCWRPYGVPLDGTWRSVSK